MLENDYRKVLIENLTKNLPMLRAKLGINQTELCEKIGVTRQTLTAIENGKREMSWIMFVALTHLFLQNEGTKTLLSVLGIYTEGLQSFLSFKADVISSEEIGGGI